VKDHILLTRRTTPQEQNNQWEEKLFHGYVILIYKNFHRKDIGIINEKIEF